MNGTILLTGATGFVGRQVLRILGERGYTIRAVVRSGTEDRLLTLQGVEQVVTTPDMFAENVEWWTNVCGDIEIVMHLAWHAKPDDYLSSPKNLDCLIGTLQLAKAASRAKVRRFVGVGTCAEYDLTAATLSIETPLKPLTPYADAKAAAFMALSHSLPLEGVEFIWCRLFYLYGEGEDARRLVPYLRSKLSAGEPAELSSGNQIRDYLDVRDVGRMLVEAACGWSQGPVNICSGVPITVRQLAMQIADEYGRLDLLAFGARPDPAFNPPCVVGRRNEECM